MNKKVYTSALVLIIVFLLAQYVLKIFFPTEFVMYIENPRIVEVGVFIDSHWWLYFPVAFAFAILSDYLFFGACCRKTKLHWSLWLIMILYNAVLIAMYTFAPHIVAQNSNLIIGLSMTYMFLTPIFYTNELKPIAITYVITNVAQLLTLAIRDFSPLLTNINSISTMLLTFESYLWAGLCLVLFNYHKGGVADGMGKTMVWKREVLGKEKSQSGEDCK